MKSYKKVSMFLLVGVIFLCTACGAKDNVTEQIQQETVEKSTEKPKAVEPKEDDNKTEEDETPVSQPIKLDNTYTTKYAEVNAVTYPNFTFDFPSNWTITNEEVTQTGETVVLSNETGVNITFSHIGGTAEGQLGGGSSTTMTRIDISKTGDSRFVPGYVQATDYSELGNFMVAKLKVTGQLDMQLDSDFQDVNGAVSYAVLPESWIGTKEDVRGAYSGEFAFWYSGYISFVAGSSNNSFADSEEQEIIEILSSFRVEN